MGRVQTASDTGGCYARHPEALAPVAIAIAITRDMQSSKFLLGARAREGDSESFLLRLRARARNKRNRPWTVSTSGATASTVFFSGELLRWHLRLQDLSRWWTAELSWQFANIARCLWWFGRGGTARSGGWRRSSRRRWHWPVT